MGSFFNRGRKEWHGNPKAYLLYLYYYIQYRPRNTRESPRHDNKRQKKTFTHWMSSTYQVRKRKLCEVLWKIKQIQRPEDKYRKELALKNKRSSCDLGIIPFYYIS